MATVIEINTAANPARFQIPDSTGGGPVIYANFAAFPAPPASGVGTTQQFAIANDTGALYCSFGGNWCLMLFLAP